MSARVAPTAGIVSQLDTPVPGPGDAVAGVLIAGAFVFGVLTSPTFMSSGQKPGAALTQEQLESGYSVDGSGQVRDRHGNVVPGNTTGRKVVSENTPTAQRQVGNLKGGPLEEATQVSGRFTLGGGPVNGTLYRADNRGNITSYATYDENGMITKRVDVTGAPHNGVSTPHVLEYGRNTLPDGSVRVQTPRTAPRPATSDELP